MSLETILTLAIAGGIVLTVLVVRLVLLVLFRLGRLVFRLIRRYVFGHQPAPAIVAETAVLVGRRPKRRLLRRGFAAVGRGLAAGFRGIGRGLAQVAATWSDKVDELAAILGGKPVERKRRPLRAHQAQVLQPVMDPTTREEPLASIR